MKKFISYLLILVVAAQMLSVVAFAATNSIYTSELAFHGQHTGVTHEYTGTDMHWYGTTYEEYGTAGNPTVFTVCLYRDNLFFDDKIGTKELPREGYHNVTWSNVGSGKYYFFYSKARDEANVCSDCITMEMTS